MTYNPDIHHRRSIRLRDYDYSSVGAYFVTLCVQNRDCLFGDIEAGSMVLNDAGLMVEKWWRELQTKFPTVMVDEFVIMPNHFHGIIFLVGAALCGRPDAVAPTVISAITLAVAPSVGHPHRGAPTLGDTMDWFKTTSTNEYIRGVKQSDWPPFPGKLWQRNYYERVIRNDNELTGDREYIVNNPLKWDQDKENPAYLS